MARKHKPGTIIDCLRDQQIFERQFSGKSWRSWRIFLRALFSLPMGPKSRKVFSRFTSRKTLPAAVTEAWMVVGRRGGKSIVAALVAVFLACFKDYSGVLAPGERGTVMVIAADRKQSRVIMRYCVVLLESVPMLAALIERKRAESIDLSNRLTIEIHTCNFRTVRGYSIVAAICDEIAFWRSEESANPDQEVINAIRPGMANVPGSVWLDYCSERATFWCSTNRSITLMSKRSIPWLRRCSHTKARCSSPATTVTSCGA